MTENQRFCRRCLLQLSGKEDILADIKARIEKIPESDRTDAVAYAERLKICSACDFLENGTCLKCGCYPEFRAAFKKNRCPIKKWSI